ncbi:CHASE3 domain sensor protein [Salinibacter ruber]|jgi:hypothetical protein|uniref:hypothetical protein n=1 Tax=Salinibacter ruber TaxID=146919 RepID=UPI0013C3251A|nr:hypothetical protein [Salinibacter ruber]MCS3685407.1 CHASE3 domain sensor protein [Salinibacter ruber]MCS3708057.1 CHASE3 domain sensor protein [Salinibacter ruber]MCS3856427.1 CHASE3 domain sensor protein [Salinibacter ruber]MCS4142212.1 CHASE3 domain sensor protein [Salinibacter ruber]MCS4181580.1 CHASE3 domain sensor protein [Salinibacter ruber]
MASQEEIDELVETFLNDLDDQEKREIIDRLKNKNPKAAKILKTAWSIEQRSDKIDQIVGRVRDGISEL